MLLQQNMQIGRQADPRLPRKLLKPIRNIAIDTHDNVFFF